MFYAWLIGRIPALKNFIQGDSIVLMKNGILDELALKRNGITKVDLKYLAKQYGHKSYDVFDEIYIEPNGHLCGTYKYLTLLPY